MIILDFGSGNSCKNDSEYIKRMIDSLAEVDKERRCIIKWQLFEKAGDNVPLNIFAFDIAYGYARRLGFKTTASVFDKSRLKFLLNFDVPFIKIANRPDLYWLIGEIPRRVDVIVSHNPLGKINLLDEYFSYDEYGINGVYPLVCISKYPAEKKEYYDLNGLGLTYGISDHTVDWDLYRRYKPQIYECHFKLPDSTGLDAGNFARTPEQLKEIL